MCSEEQERQAFERWLQENHGAVYRLAFQWDEDDEDEVINYAKASALDMRTAWMARAKQESSLRQTITELRRLTETQGGYNHSALEEEQKNDS